MINDTDTAAAAAEDKFGEDAERPNPGIEQVRTELGGAAYGNWPVKPDPALFDPETDGAFINAKPEPTIQEALDVHDANVEAARAFTGLSDGPASQAYVPTAEELAERDYWRAKETRVTALNLAARNHQGRGIPVEMLIDEAKIYATFIETGETPDFSY